MSAKGIHVDGRKVEAITKWAAPKNIKELQGFLGAANFFRRFIQRFAHITLPLTALLKKDAVWIWGEAEQAAFEALKRALSTAPVVRPPDYSKPFVLYTDASDIAVGAVVMQDHGQGPQPVAYMSRKHSPAERNYMTREKELLAIVEALREWRHYFAGKEVTVFTDHDSLRYLMTQTLPLTGRMARWLEQTQEFDLKIGYVPGKANVVADALSRMQLDDAVQEVQAAGIQLAFSTDPVRLAAVTLVAADASMLDAIKAAYRSDAMARAMRKQLAAAQSDCKYAEQQGLLYFTEGEGHARLYIPTGRNLRQRVIAEHHDAGFAGHLGMRKTQERLERLF